MEAEDPRKIPLVFYRTRSGGEVVLEWLRGLNEVDRRAIGLDLMRVQYRWLIGMPLCRAMGNGLWEVRSSLPGGRIARVFFCAHDARIVVLSGFIKKTQKTPDSELTHARQRMKEFLP